jgi:hypothetical protein
MLKLDHFYGAEEYRTNPVKLPMKTVSSSKPFLKTEPPMSPAATYVTAPSNNINKPFTQ